MGLILSLETAVSICSVALHKDGSLLAYSEIQIDRSHSEKITILIEEVVKLANANLSEIEAVAISQGPGSFTGLRVGSSTAKGLCFGLNIPLIEVDTLQAMAYETTMAGFWVCPMIDARRLEVYCSFYNDLNEQLSLPEAKILFENAYEDVLENNKVIFCGSGISKAQLLIHHPNAYFIHNIYPTAKSVGYLADKKFRSKSFADVSEYEPFYLKDFYFNKVNE